jgi:DNA-binding NarL/FixJ family response regulator
MIDVIIVDDHELFRLGVKVAIANSKSNIKIVAEAETAKELFNLLQQITVDIILLDILLPDASGIDIVHRLNKEYPKIKILVISHESKPIIVEKLIGAGINGFISKRRGGMNELVDAIETIMSEREYFGKDIASLLFQIYVSKKNTPEISDGFSKLEKEIIELCGKGMHSREIAAYLNRSIRTIDNYKSKIFRKLEINNTLDMVLYALNTGIINIEH